MNDTTAQVIIVGGGPVALIAALMLHRLGATVTLVGEAPPIYLPLNPELMLVGGDDALASLFQTSLAHWRNVSETLSLPNLLTSIAAQDLATSVGRAEKYRQESMLDAIGGEQVTFHTEASPVSPISLGYKNWDEAPILAPTMLKSLQQAVAEANISRLAVNPATLWVQDAAKPSLELENGTRLQASHIIFTSARALRRVLPPLGLPLPLRPARGHILHLQTQQPHNLPLILQRLQRGHLFFVPMGPNRIDIHYDAINDPAQSTFSSRPNKALVSALVNHAGLLVPQLQGAELLRVNTATHWLTPDFLPALGPWPGLPGVLVASGWGGRATAMAAGAAATLVEHVTNGISSTNIQSLAPNRFANGLWQVVKKPGSLTWQEPQTDTSRSMMMPKPDYAETVNLIETPKPQYAEKVQQVGKTVTENAGRRAATISTRDKKKVTTAGLRGS
ncbi:MAG: FAD-binding oxidoreductase [Alphaproteobacteria bacterium]|nr:MAG: FAD-binding oxidoreductase [Alphaproteobacteria bacterium]